MNIRKQLGVLLAVFIAGLSMVALVGAGAVLLIRSEIVSLSERTSPLQVNLAKLQRAFERVSGNFARTSSVTTAADLRIVEEDTESTLREVEMIGAELAKASKNQEHESIEGMTQTHRQLRALAAERLDSRRRVADAYHQAASDIDGVTAATHRLSQGMAELQASSQNVLIQSKKANQECNSNIKAMLVLRDLIQQLRSIVQEVRLVDKKFRLNVLRDKSKAVLDAMSRQDIQEKDLAAHIRTFTEKFTPAYESETGLLEARAATLANPQDAKAREVFEEKTKALNGTLEALGTRILESIDPMELAVRKANEGMNEAISRMTYVNRVSAATAELNARARTIQALASQLMMAVDAMSAGLLRDEINLQCARATQAISEMQSSLPALKREDDLRATAAAAGAFSRVRERLVGTSGVAALVKQELDQHAKAERLFASALASIHEIAASGSTRARDAETAQNLAVERIQRLSNGTLLLVALVGLLAIGIGAVAGRRIRGSILNSDARQIKAADDMRRILEIVQESVLALQTTSRDLTETSACVTSSIASVSAGAKQMQSSIDQIATGATRASSVGADAAELVKNATLTLDRLRDRSAEISNVTEMIRKITFQTNILALNASIEAARAGEAGRCFEVVANQVKELAKAAANATEEIDKRVKAAQDEVGSVRKVFGGVTEFVQHIREMQDEVAAAVVQQTSTTKAIGARIQETSEHFHGSDGQSGINAMALQLSAMAGDLNHLCRTDA